MEKGEKTGYVKRVEKEVGKGMKGYIGKVLSSFPPSVPPFILFYDES